MIAEEESKKMWPDIPKVFEDETTEYYEGEIDGVKIRYAQSKDQEPIPKNLPELIARATKALKSKSSSKFIDDRN